MRNTGVDSNGGGMFYSPSSLLRWRGDASVAAAIGVASAEEGSGALKDFCGVGGGGDGDGEGCESSTVIGEIEEVIKRKGVEMLMWVDLREF